MPITMHGDLIFIQYFPYFLSYKGVWDIYSYFGDHYLSQGYTYYPPLVYYVVAFFQWVFQRADTLFGAFMLHAEPLVYWAREHNTLTQEYLTPYTSRQIFQLVFYMKLPYLLADLGCLWLLGKIYSARKQEAWLCWLWSPVLIFSTYISGQYRSLSALVLWGVLFAVYKNKKNAAALLFGVLCLMESYPLYLLLPSLLVLGDGWKERAKLLALVLLPLVLLLTPLALSSKGHVFYAYFSPVIAKTVSQGISSRYPFLSAVLGKVILAAAFAGMAFVLAAKKQNGTPAGRYRLFVYVNAAMLLVLYAVTTTSVHYFMWVLPFYAAIRLDGPPWKKAWSAALVACLFLFNLDMRPLNLGLFMPLGPERFLSYPSLHEWVSGLGFPWAAVVGLSRLAFSALCLCFAVNIYFWRIRPLLYNADGSYTE